MKKIIVSTSINHPTIAIKKFDTMQDWHLIVVTDKKTPKNYKLKNGTVLSPRDQEKIDKKLSNIIGWNCIERRNIGLIAAKKMGADIVALVDDDNIPYDNWGKNLLLNKIISVKYYKTNIDAFDPIFYAGYKKLWHRGFPIDLLDKRENIKPSTKKKQVKIQADFWNSDPDIDAICRMMYKPNCSFNHFNFPFTSNKISPFNSQNTFISSDLLKDYFLFLDQGRMHDIWASYYLQYKRNVRPIYCKPSVYQKRNKHNLVTDLCNEMVGLKYTSLIIKSMNKKKFRMQNFFSKRAIEAFKLYRKHF